MDAHVLRPVTETVRKGADKAAETASEAASASMRSLSGLADHDLVPLPSPRGRRRRSRSTRSRVILLVAAIGAAAVVVWKLRASSPRDVGRADQRASEESPAAEHGIVDQQGAALHEMGSNGSGDKAAKAASDA